MNEERKSCGYDSFHHGVGMDIESMKKMMDCEFNGHLNFEKWDDKEFVDYLKDLLEGRTEYGLDDKFPKETVKGFIWEHWVPFDPLEKTKDLVDDLGWDYQRMSEGGQETYKKLCKSLGWDFEGEDEGES